MRDAIRLCLVAVAAAAALSCGGNGDQSSETAGGAPEAEDQFTWPEGPRDVAVLEIEGRGEIRIALYPEIAPKTVANFVKLASEGYYDDTTFHRVVRDFMIQGGDPYTRNDFIKDDGMGGPGYTIEDEFSRAPHVRGVVSMANRGHANSGGSQFFIVQRDRPDLDGHYAIFGRVIDGMQIVDAIAQVEVDEHGRWGPKHRPLEDVVVRTIRIEHSSGPKATPDPSPPGGAPGATPPAA